MKTTGPSIQNHRFRYYCILHYTGWLHFHSDLAYWLASSSHSLILTLHNLARHSRSNHWWQYLFLFYDTTFYFELTNSRIPKSLAKDALNSGAQYQGTPKFPATEPRKMAGIFLSFGWRCFENNPEPFSI